MMKKRKQVTEGPSQAALGRCQPGCRSGSEPDALPTAWGSPIQSVGHSESGPLAKLSTKGGIQVDVMGAQGERDCGI